MKNFCIALAFLTSCAAATAGSVSGTYVVWVNLSPDPKVIDGKISNYVNSGRASKDCWEEGSLLFMKSKPKKLTNELVKAAIYKKNAKALRRLNEILGAPFGEASTGFDGIIVYSEENGPKYYGLTTGRKNFSTLEVNPRNAEIGLCVVLPETVRKP